MLCELRLEALAVAAPASCVHNEGHWVRFPLRLLKFRGNPPLARICRWVGLDFWHEDIADVGRADWAVTAVHCDFELFR